MTEDNKAKGGYATFTMHIKDDPAADEFDVTYDLDITSPYAFLAGLYHLVYHTEHGLNPELIIAMLREMRKEENNDAASE